MKKGSHLIFTTNVVNVVNVVNVIIISDFTY